MVFVRSSLHGAVIAIATPSGSTSQPEPLLYLIQPSGKAIAEPVCNRYQPPTFHEGPPGLTPQRRIELAWPDRAPRYRIIASRTSGRIGVVALWWR